MSHPAAQTHRVHQVIEKQRICGQTRYLGNMNVNKAEQARLFTLMKGWAEAGFDSGWLGQSQPKTVGLSITFKTSCARIIVSCDAN